MPPDFWKAEVTLTARLAGVQPHEEPLIDPPDAATCPDPWVLWIGEKAPKVEGGNTPAPPATDEDPPIASGWKDILPQLAPHFGGQTPSERDAARKLKGLGIKLSGRPVQLRQNDVDKLAESIGKSAG